MSRCLPTPYSSDLLILSSLGEVARVLRSRDLYEVLELKQEELATSEDHVGEAVRSAKRLKILATHPDKVGANAIGSKEAFQRVKKVRVHAPLTFGIQMVIG